MSPSDTEKNVIEKTLIETSAGKIDGQKSQIVNDVAKAITRIPFTSLPQIQVKSAPSSTQLAGGLGGAIGSDLRRAHNQLIFVEFGGTPSTANLFKTAVVISSGITVPKGRWKSNVDRASRGGTSPAPWSDPET